MGSKLWEIRESYGERMGERYGNRDMGERMGERYGNRDMGERMGEKAAMPMSEEEREAYKCGYEHGYEDAMKESKSSMGERYGDRYMGERNRMRDSMGRFR